MTEVTVLEERISNIDERLDKHERKIDAIGDMVSILKPLEESVKEMREAVKELHKTVTDINTTHLRNVDYISGLQASFGSLQNQLNAYTKEQEVVNKQNEKKWNITIGVILTFQVIAGILTWFLSTYQVSFQ